LETSGGTKGFGNTSGTFKSGGYNNQSGGYDASQTQDGGGHYNLRHPQHEDQMNNYPQNGYGIQPQVQYNNNQ
jgi:hypothetical protein